MTLAWLCANGAIWDVVQVFAWVRMVSLYSQTMPVERAIVVTLDGSKPCELCTSVSEARDVAQKRGTQVTDSSASKLILAIEVPSSSDFHSSTNHWRSGDIAFPGERYESVPVPPPRA